MVRIFKLLRSDSISTSVSCWQLGSGLLAERAAVGWITAAKEKCSCWNSARPTLLSRSPSFFFLFANFARVACLLPVLFCSGANSVAVYVLFSDAESNNRKLVCVAQERLNLFHMNLNQLQLAKSNENMHHMNGEQ